MMKLNIRLIGALAIIAVAIFSCASEKTVHKDTTVAPVEHKQILQEFQAGIEESKKVVVARVNGTDITMFNLKKRMNQMAPQYVKQGQQMTPETLQKLESEALDVLIFRELAIQEAVRQGMKVDPAMIEQDIAAIQSRTGPADEFKRMLAMTGQTEETLREQIERDRLFLMIADREMFKKVAVDEGAVKEAYAAKQDQFLVPEELYIEDVVVSKGSDESEAMEKAQELLSLIRMHQNDISKLPSDETFAVSRIIVTEKEAPTVFRAISGMQENEVSDVTKMDDGMHIIKMVKKEPARPMTFEEAKPLIESELRSPLIEKRKQECEAELKKNAKIEIMLEEVEKNIKEEAGEKE